MAEISCIETLMTTGGSGAHSGYLEDPQNPRPPGQQDWSLEMEREWIIATEEASECIPHRMRTCIRGEEIQVATKILME